MFRFILEQYFLLCVLSVLLSTLLPWYGTRLSVSVFFVSGWCRSGFLSAKLLLFLLISFGYTCLTHTSSTQTHSPSPHLTTPAHLPVHPLTCPSLFNSPLPSSPPSPSLALTNVFTAEKVSGQAVCTAWKPLMRISTRYVKTTGEGKEGGEKTMNRDGEGEKKEREGARTEGYIDSELVCMLHRVWETEDVKAGKMEHWHRWRPSLGRWTAVSLSGCVRVWKCEYTWLHVSKWKEWIWRSLLNSMQTYRCTKWRVHCYITVNEWMVKMWADTLGSLSLMSLHTCARATEVLLSIVKKVGHAGRLFTCICLWYTPYTSVWCVPSPYRWWYTPPSIWWCI